MKLRKKYEYIKEVKDSQLNQCLAYAKSRICKVINNNKSV